LHTAYDIYSHFIIHSTSVAQSSFYIILYQYSAGPVEHQVTVWALKRLLTVPMVQDK